MVRFGNPPWRGELDKLATTPRWSAVALQHLRQGKAFLVDYACTDQKAPTTLHCIASPSDDTSYPTDHATSH
jgi:hypothetical protein